MSLENISIRKLGALKGSWRVELDGETPSSSSTSGGCFTKPKIDFQVGLNSDWSFMPLFSLTIYWHWSLKECTNHQVTNLQDLHFLIVHY